MSKSVSIQKYPQGMIEVVESVCHTGVPCPITYPDTASARRERFQFYGLIRAIKITGHSLAKHADQLTFSVTGENRNILLISLGHVVRSDFYSQVADKHRAAHPLQGPDLGDQAVAAVAAAEAQKQNPQ